MTTPSSHQVTDLLLAWSNGDQSALDQLMPLVHRELHRLAQRFMARERPGHTLQTSALVNDDFEVIGEITDIETIAINTSIREVKRLRKMFGRGRWRKLKGIATVRLPDGAERKAEVHWYEAHGIGKRKLKIKQYLD